VLYGYTDSAVHCASARGHLDCVKALHKGGADTWQASSKGDCPVHEAAMAKHNGIRQFLICRTSRWISQT